MHTETLDRLLQRFNVKLPQLKHLESSTGFSLLRHYVDGHQHWLVSADPERREHLRFLESLPRPDFFVLQPIVASAPAQARLRLIGLFAKSSLTAAHLCTALSMAPMCRAERRRVLRAIGKGGHDMIHLESDAIDTAAVTQMLGDRRGPAGRIKGKLQYGCSNPRAYGVHHRSRAGILQ